MGAWIHGAAVLLAATLSAGCGVERDLDPSRFACEQGGPCDAGASDGGSGLLAHCAGDYSGYMYGTRAAALSGTLDAQGRLTLDVLALSGTSRLLGTVTEAGVVTAEDSTFHFSGVMDTGCTVAGTWTVPPSESGSFALSM